jgi:putative exported tonB-dependent receptor protein
MSLPGINVSAHGAQYRVSVQGFSGDHVLFLVDGERLTSEGNGVVDLNRIDMASVERIEMISGAASALYGSSAIGGVINFITRRAHDRHELSASCDYSSEGTTRCSASGLLVRGVFSSMTSLSYINQKGYEVTTQGRHPDVTPVLGSKSLNLSQTLRYRSADLQRELNGYFRYGYRDQYGDALSHSRYLSHSMGGQAYQAFGDLHNLRLDYNHELYNRDRILTSSGDRSPIFHFTGNTLRLQYNFGAEEKTPVLINAGLEFYQEQLRSDRFTTATTRHRATTGTLYTQAEWHLWPKLSFVTGFRLDSHSSFGTHFSPRASVLYQLGRVRLRTSYAEGFRAPSVKEQFMDWDHFGMFFIKGSEHLRPEVSRMLSFSPEWQTSHLSLTGIASYNVISNQIGTQMTRSTNTYNYTNVSEQSRLLNLQTSLRLKLPLGVTFYGDYSYIYDFSRAESRANGQPFAPLRPHNYTTSLSYERNAGRSCHLTATYSLRGAGSITLSELDESTGKYSYFEHEGYLLSRINLSARYKQHVTFTIGVDNLSDYHPTQVNITGSLSPGRTFFTSLCYHL